MGIPNIQQQMYLKKALNENMDGMFDHPEQLDESYTMRQQYGRSAKVTPEQRAAAKAKGDAHVAKMSKTHTWVKGSGKNGGRWVPKQETNEETITEGLLHKIELAEGSIRASKIGKGKKFSPKMYDKYKTKTAVRQLIKTGRDPNSIKFPLTRGLENFGFNVNAEDKRKAALKAKGKKA